MFSKNSFYISIVLKILHFVQRRLYGVKGLMSHYVSFKVLVLLVDLQKPKNAHAGVSRCIQEYPAVLEV